MNKTAVKSQWLNRIFAGCLAVLSGGASAWAQGAQTAPTEGQTDAALTADLAAQVVAAPFTVEDVDHPGRIVAVRSPKGERMSFNVPEGVLGFWQLKKGDRIEVDYNRAVAIEVLPTRARPGQECPIRTSKSTRARSRPRRSSDIG